MKPTNKNRNKSSKKHETRSESGEFHHSSGLPWITTV